MLSPDELRAALRDYDAVLPTLGDRFQRRCLCRCSATARADARRTSGWATTISTWTAAKAAGLAVTNTPGAVTDATADIALTPDPDDRPAGGRGRADAARGEVGRLGADADAGHPCHRQDASASSAWAGSARPSPGAATTGFDMEVVFYNRSAVADPGVPARQVDAGRGDGAPISWWWPCRAGTATHHLINAKTLGNDEANRHLREHLARRCGGRGGADRQPCRRGGSPGRGWMSMSSSRRFRRR